jgi:hypothetical protein
MNARDLSPTAPVVAALPSSNPGLTSPLDLTAARSARDGLRSLLGAERSAAAEFLLALADFDARRGWEPLGHASLFALPLRTLGARGGRGDDRTPATPRTTPPDGRDRAGAGPSGGLRSASLRNHSGRGNAYSRSIPNVGTPAPSPDRGRAAVRRAPAPARDRLGPAAEEDRRRPERPLARHPERLHRAGAGAGARPPAGAAGPGAGTGEEAPEDGRCHARRRPPPRLTPPARASGRPDGPSRAARSTGRAP